MRILIADDHDLLRDTLTAFLSAEESLETTSAANLDEAVAKIRAEEPYNLVLLDYKMLVLRFYFP